MVGDLNSLTATALPLNALPPPSPSGCTLWVSPDFIAVQFTSTGRVEQQLSLPNKSALAGLVFHQQLVVLELDAQLNVVETTGSNAFTSAIGVF